MSTDIQDARKAAYAKGYAAGRKKTELEAARFEATYTEVKRANRERCDRLFCAALQGMLAGDKTWTRNRCHVTTVQQYVDLALEFVHAATTKLPI